MIVSIRAARAEDAVPCARILGDWFTATQWLPRLHTPAEDLAFLRGLIGHDQVHVADQRGIAVGFFARDRDALLQLYVADAFRHRGIGGRLLTEAKSHVNRLELWCFQANEGARRFHERHGFHCVETTDGARNEEGVPDMRYVWEAAE